MRKPPSRALLHVSRSMIHERDRGIALVMTLMMVSVLVVTVLGIGYLSVQQVRIAEDLKDSTVAIVAADAGIEEGLFQFWRSAGFTGGVCGSIALPGTCAVCENPSRPCVLRSAAPLASGATYFVTYDFSTTAGTDVSGRWIRSTGDFRGLRRAFFLSGL